ncbi:hypothetical protein ACFE04_004123 [Oxalis oulophora]
MSYLRCGNFCRVVLKETQRKFSEYRERCHLQGEMRVKDVPEFEGLVLSTMELEKQRMKQEEDEKILCLLVEKKTKEIEDEWMDKLDSCKNTINLLDDKLLGAENEAKLIMGSLVKVKKDEVAECHVLDVRRRAAIVADSKSLLVVRVKYPGPNINPKVRRAHKYKSPQRMIKLLET